MRKLQVAAALAALVVWAGAAFGQAKDPKSYKIGAILAMSGQASFYDTVMSQDIKHVRLMELF